MCGIGLAWLREGVNVELVDQLMQGISLRGQDAFGFAHIRDGEIIATAHHPKPYSELQLQPAYWEKVLKTGDIVVASARAKPMTEVASEGEDTIQPIVFADEGLVLVHNGCVANEDEDFPRRTKLDSEVFLHRYLQNGRDPVRTMKQMVGGGAYILIDLKRGIIIAARDFKPLGKAYRKGVGYFIQSDREEFYPMLGDMDVAVWENFYYSDMEPYAVQEIDIDSGLIDRTKFGPTYVSSLPASDSNKALVLASGGIDSSTAACIAKYHLGKEVVLCHFDLGQKSEMGEWQAVTYLAETINCDVRLINLQALGTLGASVLTNPELDVPQSNKRSNLKNTVCWTPARNLVMCSYLLAVAEATGASEIYNGWSLEESNAYPDNSLDFFRAMNNASDFGTLTRPRIKMVESRLMKPEIVKLAYHFGLDLDRLWSCDTYPSDGNMCGTCGCCWLRLKAIEDAAKLDRPIAEILDKVLA